MKRKIIHLKIPKSLLIALQDLADKRGDSLENTLRHSINTEAYFNTQLEKGNKILVQDKTGEIYKIVFSHMMGS